MQHLLSFPEIRRIALPALILATLLGLPLGAVASDKHDHEGYYYPKVTSSEIYTSEATVEPGATRKSRLAFIVGFTSQQLSRGYAPNYAMFAKGDDADEKAAATA